MDRWPTLYIRFTEGAGEVRFFRAMSSDDPYPELHVRVFLLISALHRYGVGRSVGICRRGLGCLRGFLSEGFVVVPALGGSTGKSNDRGQIWSLVQ